MWLFICFFASFSNYIFVLCIALWEQLNVLRIPVGLFMIFYKLLWRSLFYKAFGYWFVLFSNVIFFHDDLSLIFCGVLHTHKQHPLYSLTSVPLLQDWSIVLHDLVLYRVLECGTLFEPCVHKTSSHVFWFGGFTKLKNIHIYGTIGSCDWMVYLH